MTRPTNDLHLDHVLVAKGLAVLAGIGRYVQANGSFPAADCALALRFLREFVIAVHMRKEASVLCPALVMHGSAQDATLVGNVLRMHDEVVELTHALVLFWEPSSALSADEREGFAKTVAAVVARLSRLELLEEEKLFPLCESKVPVDDRLGWAAEFERIERRAPSRRSWEERLARLATSWLA